jgi:carbonic anhydrase
VVKQLQGSPVIKGLIEKKEIAVIGGYYSLGTGQVEWLSK